jgi:3-methyladenine DNA glycosylase/8-oxoguanine DNA glycosylase
MSADAALQRTLQLARPLDLRATLAVLAHGHGVPSLRFESGASVWHALHTAGGPATLHISMQGLREVSASAWGPGAAAALDRLPALLGEDDDDSGFVPHHRIVARLHQRLRGMRMPRTGAVFDALVPAVLAQRVTSTEAHTATVRLHHLAGEPAPGPASVRLRLPPTPRRLAALPSWDYHRAGVERQRADTVRRAARIAGRLEEAVSMPRDAAMARLQSIPGIGPWTAASVAMVAFGDADAIPVGDYNLPHMVSWVLAGESRGDDARMLELLEPYRGHRARVARLLLAGGLRQPRHGPRRALRDLAAI